MNVRFESPISLYTFGYREPGGSLYTFGYREPGGSLYTFGYREPGGVLMDVVHNRKRRLAAVAKEIEFLVQTLSSGQVRMSNYQALHTVLSCAYVARPQKNSGSGRVGAETMRGRTGFV
jgi:hypothetical protein